MRISRLSAAASALVLVSMMGLTVAAQQRGSSAQPSLKGVWLITEWTSTGPGGHTNKSPQPWYCIYTDKHFVYLGVGGDVPRDDLPPADKRTDKDIVAAYNPFVAEMGTLEAAGGEMKLTRLVTKDPAGMRPGRNIRINTYRFEGADTMWLSTKAVNNEPVANPVTWKMVRVE